jgi:hypothetical protein
VRSAASVRGPREWELLLLLRSEATSQMHVHGAKVDCFQPRSFS